MRATTSGEDPDDFNYFAGIDAYQAAQEAVERLRKQASAPDFEAKLSAQALESMQSTVKKLREWTPGPELKLDATEAARSAIERMRQQAGSLDSFTRPQANLAIRANEEWLEAEEKKARTRDVAEQQDDVGPVVQEEEVPSTPDQWRIVEVLTVMRAIHSESKASSGTLREIRAAHGLAERRQDLADQRQASADRRQKEQEKTNNWIRNVGLLVAAGSFVAAIFMPMWEHHVWDAEKEKREAAQKTATVAPANDPPPAAEPPQSVEPGDDCRPDMSPARFLSCLAPLPMSP